MQRFQTWLDLGNRFVTAQRLFFIALMALL